MSVPEVKTRVLRGLLGLFENIPDAVIRSEYLKETAEVLGLDESVLRRLSQPRPAEKNAEPGEEFTPAERRLIQILVESPPLRPAVLAELGEEDIQGLKSEPVFRIIFGLYRKDKNLIFHDLQKEIGPALSRRVGQALLAKGGPATAEEARDCICALKTKAKEMKLIGLQAEIARQEKRGEVASITALQRRKQDLLKEILALRNA
jgi:hypothetical protein